MPTRLGRPFGLMFCCAALAGFGLAQTGGSTGGAPTGGAEIGGSLSQTTDPYYQQGQETLQRMLEYQPNTNRARNVIIFVADGAGPTTVTATRILEGQLRGMLGEENVLSFETFPNVALVKTYNTNAQVADSAGTSTAWNTGVKTKQGVLSVGPGVLRGECESAEGQELVTLVELAESAGMATGLISTARVTHATPAAAYAHAADRNWEDDSALSDSARVYNAALRRVSERFGVDVSELECADIARQLIEFSYGDGIELVFGGGRRHFLPAETNDPEDEGEVGNRTDGRDLTQEWVEGRDGAVFVWNEEDFSAIDPATTGPVLGLFEGSHLEYEADRETDTAGEPSLSEMVSKAIDILSRNENGYLLEVEAGRVDHASHGTNAYRTLTDNVEFARAVQTALDKVSLDDTLIIVTADHAHTMDIAGYPHRGNPILGLVRGLDAQGLPVSELALGADEKPYTTIGFYNGPGAEIGERSDLTNVDTTDSEFRQQAAIPLSSETHDGTDVAAYANGPMAHLVRGVVEQSYLFHVVEHALDLRARAGETAGLMEEARLVEAVITVPAVQDMGTGGVTGGDPGTGGAGTGGDVTLPTESAKPVSPTLEETIATFEGGLTDISVEAGRELVMNWQQQISSLNDPTLEPLVNDLGALSEVLAAEPVDTAEAARLLASLGETSQMLSEDLRFEPNREKLERLGALLVQASESLSSN